MVQQNAVKAFPSSVNDCHQSWCQSKEHKLKWTLWTWFSLIWLGFVPSILSSPASEAGQTWPILRDGSNATNIWFYQLSFQIKDEDTFSIIRFFKIQRKSVSRNVKYKGKTLTQAGSWADKAVRVEQWLTYTLSQSWPQHSSGAGGLRPGIWFLTSCWCQSVSSKQETFQPGLHWEQQTFIECSSSKDLVQNDKHWRYLYICLFDFLCFITIS